MDKAVMPPALNGVVTAELVVLLPPPHPAINTIAMTARAVINQFFIVMVLALTTAVPARCRWNLLWWLWLWR
jgi:hypothetical protein